VAAVDGLVVEALALEQALAEQGLNGALLRG
jgi:hypothetical protein